MSKERHNIRAVSCPCDRCDQARLMQSTSWEHIFTNRQMAKYLVMAKDYAEGKLD